MTREVSGGDAGGVQTPKNIFKTAAVFVLKKEKRLMSPREITQFALVNELLMFPGETKKQKTPIQSMENALNADANQTNENERVFVRVIVDENRPFFGLREWHNDPTLKYLLLQKEEKKKRKADYKYVPPVKKIPVKKNPAVIAAPLKTEEDEEEEEVEVERTRPVVVPIWPTDPILTKERSEVGKFRVGGWGKRRGRGKQKQPTKEDYKTSAEELSEVIKRVKERLENIDSRLHRLETLVSTNMASFGQSLDRIGELVEPFLGAGERERKRAGEEEKEEEEEEEEEDADVNDLRNSPRFRPMVRKSEE